VVEWLSDGALNLRPKEVRRRRKINQVGLHVNWMAVERLCPASKDALPKTP